MRTYNMARYYYRRRYASTKFQVTNKNAEVCALILLMGNLVKKDKKMFKHTFKSLFTFPKDKEQTIVELPEADVDHKLTVKLGKKERGLVLCIHTDPYLNPVSIEVLMKRKEEIQMFIDDYIMAISKASAQANSAPVPQVTA